MNTSAGSVKENTFYTLINNPIKFKFFLIKKLPAALLSGVKLLNADEKSCTVSVPFKYFTQNPFRSTYFACLSMAAEMTTGVLGMANIYQRKPSVSMLIVSMEARFHKKATSVTVFTCIDGPMFKEVVEKAIITSEPQIIKAHSVGKNSSGEIIAEFWFTWSFKTKSNK